MPRAVLLSLVTAIAVALAATFTFVTFYHGRVVPGVRVDGVALGGLPPELASRQLGAHAQTLGGTTLEVRAGDVVWRPTLAELGLRVDARSLADRAYQVGRVGSPIERSLAAASALVRPVDLAAPMLDRERLATWVDAVADTFDRRPQDASPAILPTGEVDIASEVAGRTLDRDAAVAALADTLDRWMHAGAEGLTPPGKLDLRFQSQPPRVVSADLATARAEAETALARPLRVRVDERAWWLGRADLARLLTFRRDGALVALDANASAVEALIDRIAGEVDRKPVDASLSTTSEGKVVFTSDAPGVRLDRATARRQLVGALLAAGGAQTTELALPAERLPARIRADDLGAARRIAERALAGPVTLVAGDKSRTFQPSDLAPALRAVPSASGGRIDVETAKLRPTLEKLAVEVERAPRNARLRVVGGSGAVPDYAVGMAPGGSDASLETIEEGVPGQKLDVGKALDIVGKKLTTSADRSIQLPLETQPAITAADRAAFGPLELIEASMTSYAGSIPERAHNVELAASRLDGVVVPPGATFSFNQALGPTTTDNGYQVAWGIMGGQGTNPKTVPSVGGGICQVATTLFHSVFWAGYQIEQRNWHLYWIPKYGVAPKGLQGLDATVDEEFNVDLQWTNTTDAPVLIQARTGGSHISFALYGKRPTWQVDVSQPVIDQVVKTSPGTVYQPDPTLPAGSSVVVEEARDGFRSTIVRTVTAPGAEPRVLRLVSTYEPSRNVIVTGTGGRRA